MPRKRGGRWANQAALESLLRFGPEYSGLRELQLAAQQQFTTGVRQATAGRRAVGQAIGAARPEVRAIYDRAGERTGETNAVLGGSMANAPASLQAALAQEQAGFSNRLEESKAAALTDLKERRVSAREGEHTAIRAARDEFANTLQQVMRRKMDLQREEGTFTALRTGELRQAAQERADQFALKEMDLTQSERNSLRSAGIDPNTGRPIPGGPLTDGGGGSNGRDWATPTQHGAAGDAIQLAMSEARNLKKLGGTRQEVAELLKSGADDDEIHLHDPQTGKPLYNEDGTPKTRRIPGVQQVKSQLLLSAALDEIFDGYVSKTNVRRLHSRGLRIRDLPLTTHRDWRRAITNSGAGQHPRT